jgi:acetyltransferase-like isoleucine patch superfamily enzyme
MPNVTVGENSIVGAFSYVTKDIPKNVMAFGTPARVVRSLTPEEIQKLEEETQ